MFSVCSQLLSCLLSLSSILSLTSFLHSHGLVSTPHLSSWSFSGLSKWKLLGITLFTVSGIFLPAFFSKLPLTVIRKPQNKWEISSCDLFSLLYFSCHKLGGNYDSHFDVDKGTGTIIIAKPLDAEQKSNYNLTVEATDGTTTILTQVGGGRRRVCPRRIDTAFWSRVHGQMAVDSALWGSQIRSYYSDSLCIPYTQGFLFREWKFTTNPDLGFACN